MIVGRESGSARHSGRAGASRAADNLQNDREDRAKMVRLRNGRTSATTGIICAEIAARNFRICELGHTAGALPGPILRPTVSLCDAVSSPILPAPLVGADLFEHWVVRLIVANRNPRRLIWRGFTVSASPRSHALLSCTAPVGLSVRF